MADWKVLAVGVEVAVAAACVVLGYQLVHGHPSAQSLNVKVAAAAPAPAVMGIPGMPALSTPSGAPSAKRPGLSSLLQRINSDDARLYRGQWASIQLLAGATRDYAERHILPMLLAAARGAGR
ncbi:MAG: hypothetical protein ACR2MY_00525 [Candidatus Dormibacteria bacterium]